jgi:hypothetical protein
VCGWTCFLGIFPSATTFLAHPCCEYTLPLLSLPLPAPLPPSEIWTDRACLHDTGWRERYQSFHRSQLALGRNGSYLLLYPSAGLGNRLFGWASAFAVALVTERALLVEDAVLLPQLYDTPNIRANVRETPAVATDSGFDRDQLAIYSAGIESSLQNIEENGFDFSHWLAELRTNAVLWPAIAAR